MPTVELICLAALLMIVVGLAAAVSSIAQALRAPAARSGSHSEARLDVR